MVYLLLWYIDWYGISIGMVYLSVWYIKRYGLSIGMVYLSTESLYQTLTIVIPYGKQN